MRAAWCVLAFAYPFILITGGHHMPSITDRDDWKRLQAAEQQLFEAARSMAQARTLLEVNSLRSPSYEEFALKHLTEAVTALGYKLVKAAAPASSTVTILPLDPEEEAA